MYGVFDRRNSYNPILRAEDYHHQTPKQIAVITALNEIQGIGLLTDDRKEIYVGVRGTENKLSVFIGYGIDESYMHGIDFIPPVADVQFSAVFEDGQFYTTAKIQNAYDNPELIDNSDKPRTMSFAGRINSLLQKHALRLRGLHRAVRGSLGTSIRENDIKRIRAVIPVCSYLLCTDQLGANFGLSAMIDENYIMVNVKDIRYNYTSQNFYVSHDYKVFTACILM